MSAIWKHKSGKTHGVLGLCCFAMFAGMSGPTVAADSDSIDLSYRSYRQWTINLPSFKWFEVKDGIKIAHAKGDRFAVAVEGNSLRFDTNGDGKLDRTIKPLVDRVTNVSTSRVVLSGKTKKGAAFRYAIRLQKDARGWEWAPGGAMSGTIKGDVGPIPIRIIDQNGDGSFDDIGIDSMIVGSGDEAVFLSETIVVDNKLRKISITPEGNRITVTAYSGPTTKFDMTTSFNANGALLSAIVRSTDGKNSFDFGGSDGPLEIPAGDYEFVAGAVGLAQHRVKIGTGRMHPFKLGADQQQTLKWGGPVQAEFTFARAGDKVQFSPANIWYYGQAGEEYFNWTPQGKSPEYKVINAGTGALFRVAVCPGST
ncbi:uncharacterized protein METZ01_LOCUS101260 [marine metagenome]|uniref:Uncharacterized protein n=1 Tax=marine metagenome TaxID=408172 RepID=A0A381W776_9ZZZZ